MAETDRGLSEVPGSEAATNCPSCGRNLLVVKTDFTPNVPGDSKSGGRFPCPFCGARIVESPGAVSLSLEEPR